MGSKMLVDASQREETRVVVARGSRIEEFDFESASRKPLKGNIYLAKVTRVEPSLQAAFVDYGGNRHGFLAFAEIHPDYYQIPIADRLALIREQEEEDAAYDEENGNGHDNGHDGNDEESSAEAPEQHEEDDQAENGESNSEHNDDEPSAEPPMALAAEPAPSLSSEIVADDFSSEAGHEETEENTEADQAPAAGESSASGEIVSVEEEEESRKVESVGAEDALEEVPQRPRRQQRRRTYKIQEVIKRRQILLVQVVKEERGNKGAALTTYLSLAGRYCVLMPNTARGGGISRKITDAGDRRRLKEVARDVEVPQGMGLIVRTAGAQRTRPEIKRDFDYLLRLWESVRDLTLQSQAPCLVYEEGSLIKRSIRDLYTKDVDEVIVEGEEAYREAKDFMKMLMPSHAKNVKLYTETRPLFQRYQVESHLDALFSPSVTLPSGGYIVINQTEALVSIDINSGKATREHNIEDTATKTNLEACDEIARQLRLRDLAGLVVIDFIDMEENRNNRNVERRIKEALKNDRARIQVGRISHFGLLEMSRQRLRPGLIEGTFRTCPHCEGRGMTRSIPSCGLGVLRSIEDTLQKRPENLTVTCAREVAFYLLNEKRDSLLALEQTFGVTIFVVPGSHDLKGTQTTIERANDREHTPRRIAPAAAPVRIDSGYANDGDAEDESAEEEIEDSDVGAGEDQAAGEDSQGDGDRKEGGRKRRRRGRRGGRRGERDRGDQPFNGAPRDESLSAESDDEGNAPAEYSDEGSDNEPVSADDAGHADETNNGEAAGEDNRNAIDGDRPRRGRDRFGRQRGRRGGRGERGERNDRGDRPAPRAEAEEGEAVAEPAFEGASADAAERPERGERPGRGERGNRGGRNGRRDRPERTSERTEDSFVPAAREPQPAIIIPDVIAEPEPRKWQPPAPTVQAEVTEKKGGWWSKRK